MAIVKPESASSTRPIKDDGCSALIGGLLAKAVLFASASGEIVATHCEVDRLRGWVEGLVHQPTRVLPGPLRNLIEDARASGQAVCNREIVIPSSSGEDEPFHASSTPTRNAAGAVTGFIVAVYDLTPVRELSTNLNQLIRLASIGTLSAGLAHEIKNAMVAVNTFVEILVSKHQDAELAPIVAREVRRIDRIVAQMLRVSNPKPIEFSPVHVHELLDHAIAVTQHRTAGGKIQLVRKTEADSDVVQGEASQLEQAFVNLLFNAVEAMESQGTLTVASRLFDRPDGSPIICLTFTDTGAGIPREIVDRIFDGYITTKTTGNGLGLVVTKRIIQEHGGAIRVQSEVGQGTTFTVELPSGARQP